MKKLRQRNEDFSKQFDRLTLKDIIQPMDNTVSIKEILAIKEFYNIKWPENATFMQRMLEFQPITPKRYVWHVGGVINYPGSSSDLLCFSIATEGIKSNYGRSDHQVVFANNNSDHCSRFFPFINMSDWDPCEPGINYWRIDTHAFDAEWYVDPNLLDLLSCINGDPTDYICTPSDIPAHALKLYHYPESLFEHTDPQRVLDYSSYDIRLLEPDKRVNWWIRKKTLAA